MPVQFFGQYLLEHGIITRDQLLAAIAFQEALNLKIGEYGVERGYITEEQTEQINARQQTKDLRFGDAAIELNLLTPAQVFELVTIQRNSHVFLGDALIQQGFINHETLANALNEFAREQNEYEVSIASLEGLNLPDREIFETCFNLTKKLLLRMWDVRLKLGRAVVEENQITVPGYVVCVLLKGDLKLNYILAAPASLVQKGAEKILNLDEPDDETCEDLLREFANVVCGNLAAWLAKRGRRCELQPPKSTDNQIVLTPQQGLVAELVTTADSGAMVLTFDPPKKP